MLNPEIPGNGKFVENEDESIKNPESYEGVSLEIMKYFEIPENNKMFEDVLYFLYYSFYESIKNTVDSKGRQNLKGIDKFLASIINILEEKERNYLLDSIHPYQKVFIMLAFFLNSLTAYIRANPEKFKYRVSIPNGQDIKINNSLIDTEKQSDLFKIVAKASLLIQSSILFYDKRKTLDKITSIFEIELESFTVEYNGLVEHIKKGGFSVEDIFLLSYFLSVEKYPSVLIVKPGSSVEKKYEQTHNKILNGYGYTLGLKDSIKEVFILLEAFCKHIWIEECISLCAADFLKNNNRSDYKKVRASQDFRQQLAKLWENWEFKEDAASSIEINFGGNDFIIPVPFFSAKFVAENYNQQNLEVDQEDKNKEKTVSNLIENIGLKSETKEAKRILIASLLGELDEKIKVLVDGNNVKKSLTLLSQIPLNKLTSIKFLMDEISLKFKSSKEQSLYKLLKKEYGERSKNEVSFSRIRFENKITIRGIEILNVVIFDIHGFNRLLVYEESDKIVFNIYTSGFYHDGRR